MVNKITTPPTQNEVIDKINELVDGKQDTLVSGTNIKTVGGNSLLGSGNVAFPTVDQTYSATSANAQSGVAVANAIAPKQDTLVSGTNIKTINGNSLLGSGNITIETSSTPNVDGETISYNSSDALQAIAVKNVRDGSTLPIWHGTEYQWNHGDPTTWYYWQTSVTALWTSGGNLPSAAKWYGLAYGDGRFVATSESSDISAYSTDGGATWQSGGNLPDSGNWHSVAYGNGVFVTVKSSSALAAYSTDGGVTWNSATLPSFGYWEAVAFGNGVFVTVAFNSSKSAYSTDNGATWVEVSLPRYDGWMGLAYGDGNFVVTSDSYANGAYSTDDGLTWNETTLPSNYSKLSFGDGKFIAIAYGKSTFAYSIDGGLTWNTASIPPYNWRSLTYGDGKFVAITSTDLAAYSTDSGATWQSVTLPSSGSWRGLAYGNGVFVTVKSSSTDSAIFTVQYDKCYTDTANPTTSSTVYSEPNVTSSYTISSVTSGAITLSNNNTYYYNQSGNVQTYDTIGNSHPEYLCFIDGVGVKMGNTMIATNNSNS